MNPMNLRIRPQPLRGTRRLIATATPIAAAALLAACGGGGDDGPQAVEIRFATFAGSTAVDCSTASIASLGSTSATGRLRDARFYIANVSLVRSDGTEVPLTLPANDDWNATVGTDRVTLVDLENNTGACVGTAATNPSVKGTVPAGNYVGVRMTLGVPFSLNHTNQGAGLDVTPAAVNNAVHPGMAWAWASGRKFAKIELTDVLATEPAGTPGKWTAPVFNVHLGSVGCTGANPAAGQVSGCAAANRVALSFASFNPATDVVRVDVQSLVAGNDVTANVSGPTGCMSGWSDFECSKVFEALQVGFDGAAPAGATFTVAKVGDPATFGLPINGGAAQTVFKAAAR
ncbi:MAG: metallo-mystery pair system four-Cys motif protein [Ideonella sp.]|nr:metallo-mystery pair system four-Cys motif protein [Ideonella sp.]